MTSIFDTVLLDRQAADWRAINGSDIDAPWLIDAEPIRLSPLLALERPMHEFRPPTLFESIVLMIATVVLIAALAYGLACVIAGGPVLQ